MLQFYKISLIALFITLILAVNVAAQSKIQIPVGHDFTNLGIKLVSSDIPTWITKPSEIVSDSLASLNVWLQTQTTSFRGWYGVNREKIVVASKLAENISGSNSYSIALLIAFVFALQWGRKEPKQYRILFTKLMAKAPVPLNRHAGVTDDQVRIVRELLFFSCVYILYEPASQFLTFGALSAVSLYSDLIFSSVILVMLLRAYRRLNRNILNRKTLSSEKKADLQAWFNGNFEHLHMSANVVRRTAIGLYVVTFGPLVIAHLPQILDYLVA